MLIEFFGRNFGCFRDEFRLSMLATDIDPDSDRGIIEVAVEGDDEPLRLLRLAAIYGANASGKSTLVRAPAVLRRLMSARAVRNSDEPIAGYEPFALSDGPPGPVELGLTGVVGGRVCSYELRFDASAVRDERLVHRGADGREHVLFHRTGGGVTGEWTGHEVFKLLSSELRPNGVLVALADRLASSLAADIVAGLRRLLPSSSQPSHDSFDARLAVAGRVHNDRAFATWLLERLAAADLGVTDVRLVALAALDAQAIAEGLARYGMRDENDPGDLRFPKPGDMRTLQLVHRGAAGEIPLSYSRESLGTRRLVAIAPLVYDLMTSEKPRAWFLDEFDTSLHPLLLEALVRQMNEHRSTDKPGGQLVFTTHETALMEGEARHAALRRDQVYFTEKKHDGAATLYSAAEFKERNVLNLRRRYLQGRYGAIPALGQFRD